VRPAAQESPISDNVRDEIIEQKRRFFTLGQRDIFDPFGLRVALRLGLWDKEHAIEDKAVLAALEALQKRKYAFILETGLLRLSLGQI
jgi:hypothetical protein